METPAPIKLTQPGGTTLINMGVAALIIAGLYFGREIFVPVALAVLLSFVLAPFVSGAVAELVGIEVGVVSGVINLESSGVEASDWRPRHDEHYHEV